MGLSRLPTRGPQEQWVTAADIGDHHRTRLHFRGDGLRDAADPYS